MTQHPASLFSLATGSAEPLYRQLVDQVRRLIAGGQLLPGDGMPSVRDIAQTLAVNPMTVSKAYSILELEGVLTRRRGMGMTVAEGRADQRSLDHRAGLLRPALERAAREALQLEIDNDTVIALLTAILKEKS